MISVIAPVRISSYDGSLDACGTSTGIVGDGGNEDMIFQSRKKEREREREREREEENKNNN